jgi:hypothetical protein
MPSEEDPSTTDFVTNIIRLQSLRLHDHLAGIINGELSSDWLPAILHEGTHHWCFLTPLGQALTLQQLRARSLLLANENLEGCTAEVTDSLIRAQAIESALRPIAEGLSLLLELHGILDNTRLGFVSRAQWWTLWIGLRTVPDIDKFHIFSEVFIDQALSDVGLERRIEILTNPFDCRFGGYLPGYLATRALWQKAATAFPEQLHEVGAFIAAVRFAIYYDPMLLELAIRTEVSDPKEISRIAISRIEELLQPDQLRKARRGMTRLWLEGEIYTYKNLQTASTCEESIKDEAPKSILYGDELTAAMLALGSLLNRVESFPDPASPDKLGGKRWLLRRRELFWLASEQVSIQRLDNLIAMEANEGWLVIGALTPGHGVPEGPIEARVDVVFSLPDTWLVVMVSSSEGFLSVTPVMGTHFNELLIMVRGIDTIEHAEAILDEEAQSRLPQELKLRLEELRHFAFQQADQWSARVAFHGLPEERVASCVDALRFDGWRSVFDDDAEALRALALFSTAVTLGPYQRESKDLFLEKGIAPDALVRAQAKLTQFGSEYLLQPQSFD